MITSNKANSKKFLVCLFYTWFGLVYNIQGNPVNTPNPIDLIPEDFKQLYIVFAGPYPASPSSAFGHILLVFEPETNVLNDSALLKPQLWTALNYAGDTKDYGHLEILWYGLNGYLDGHYEVLPFYEKIREYAYLDSREIWLFPIELSNSEKKSLITNLKNRNKPKSYRFTDKNCATEIADLILETIGEKRDYHAFGLPQEIFEITSIKNRLAHPYLIKSYNDQISNVLESKKGNTLTQKTWSFLDSIDVDKKILLLRTTEWLSVINYEKIPHDTKLVIRRLRVDLLNKKSSSTHNFLDQAEFKMHKPARIGFSRTLSLNGSNVTEFNFRLGLHDIFDFTAVYPKYDYLNILKLSARTGNNKLRINEFWIFEQKSRYPTNGLIKVPSWDLSLGAKRYNFSDSKELMFGLFGGFGKTYSYFKNKIHISPILGTHLVTSSKNSFSTVLEPTLEKHIIPSNKLRVALKVTHPVLLNDIYSSYTNFDSTLLFNFRLNKLFFLKYSVENKITYSKIGLKLNFSY